MTTVVTALYDIGREHLKGCNAYRPFDKYLTWFKNLLQLNAPMVIFIQPNLVAYLKEYRPSNYQTTVVVREFEDLKAYKYHDRIQAVINKMVATGGTDHGCPEFITAKYEVIVFSKFDFLLEVVNNNPFHTDYFIWLDAGIWYSPAPFKVTLPWPDFNKISILGDKFLVNSFTFNKADKQPLKDKRSYLNLGRRNEICAYILGGSKLAVTTIHNIFWQEVETALQLNVINNEQHLLQLLVLEHEELFYVWPYTKPYYPRISSPMNERMIPYELAQFTTMHESYPICPEILVLSVATSNIRANRYSLLTRTAKQYGYKYKVIGQDKPWTGFKLKLSLIYLELQSVKEPIVIIIDAIDTFLCLPATEAYTKFLASGESVIIGAESKLHYPAAFKDGRANLVTKEQMKSYLASLTSSRHCYPNGGFVIGKTSALLDLYSKIQDYDDDQAAYQELIYKGEPISIDYQTKFVGNVPNYNHLREDSTKYFSFDTKRHRYKNVDTGREPVAFHFPGQHWGAMNQYFTTIHGMSEANLLAIENSNPNAGYYVLIIILILLVIILAILYLL